MGGAVRAAPVRNHGNPDTTLRGVREESRELLETRNLGPVRGPGRGKGSRAPCWAERTAGHRAPRDWEAGVQLQAGRNSSSCFRHLW